MEPPIIDVSTKIFNHTHLIIRFGLTLMMWFGTITLIVDSFTTSPAMANHHSIKTNE